jgi:hypothetical protein
MSANDCNKECIHLIEEGFNKLTNSGRDLSISW